MIPDSVAIGDQPRWQVDVLETSTWTIVGTESTSYTFWIPPYVEEMSQPITPFPMLKRYMAPGQAAENNVNHKYDHQFTSLNPNASEMATL